MKVSIVIPTYNHLEDALRPCVESVTQYTEMSRTEIIVVANGCTDGTRAFCESFQPSKRLRSKVLTPERVLDVTDCGPVKMVWFDEPMGYPKSINAGVRVASGEYVVLLNNDTAVLPSPKNQWIDMLAEPFLKDPSYGVTGSLGKVSEATGRFFCIFCCAMIPKAVFDRIGLLDEGFHPGFAEDMEFCWRAEENGYKVAEVPIGCTKIFDPAAKLWVTPFPLYHRSGGTFGDYDGQQIVNRNIARLKAMYEKKYPPKG